MTDHGAPPTIPVEFQLYDSYVEDPKWQRKFSIIWASLIAGAVAYSLPHLGRAIWNGKAFVGFWGVREEWDFDAGQSDTTTVKRNRTPTTEKSFSFSTRVESLLSMIRSIFLWTLPGLRLNFGQLIVIVVYLIIILICLITDSQLASNSNRAGFLAIAQLPPLYLFATKNSVLAFLLGPGHGYAHLNKYHRLLGFTIFLLGFIHGSLWISNHLTWGLPILSQQKEGSGVATLGCVGVLGVTSVRWVREGTIFKTLGDMMGNRAGRFGARVGRLCEILAGLSYEWFWVIHLLVSTAFFITLCYHTSFAPPWIFPPLAFFGADLFMRMIRVRMKDAELWGVDRQMSVLRIPYTSSGWSAGQHVRLRVFFGGGRVFESHPLTIMNAPKDVSCLSLADTGLAYGPEAPGIFLGARVSGDWTKSLNEYARTERDRILAETSTDPQNPEKESPPTDVAALSVWGRAIPTLVSIDGPYGGVSIDPGAYETVLLVAGGSGATFTLGVLDELVGRIARGRLGGERTKRVEFVWCIKSFACISWLAPLLRSIALAASSTLSSFSPIHLHISIYVTCLCSPESVPEIPGMDVTVSPRPDVGKILRRLFISTASDLEGAIPVKGESEKGNKADCCCAPEDTVPTDSESNSIVETTTPRPPSSASIDDDPKVLKQNNLEWGPHTILPSKLPRIPLGGGIAVCASGPESLTREASNAVARLGMSSLGMKLGNVGLHTEVFKI